MHKVCFLFFVFFVWLSISGDGKFSQLKKHSSLYAILVVAEKVEFSCSRSCACSAYMYQDALNMSFNCPSSVSKARAKKTSLGFCAPTSPLATQTEKACFSSLTPTTSLVSEEQVLLQENKAFLFYIASTKEFFSSRFIYHKHYLNIYRKIWIFSF